MDDLSRFCCLNAGCPDHGKRNHGNLTVPARYGPSNTRVRRCPTCKARFSERKGTPLYGTRLPAQTVESVLAHVAEGVGTRKTARLAGVNKDTVTRYVRQAGEQAQQRHDELVALSPRTNELRLDEKWAYVAREEKICGPDDRRRGDCGDHAALDLEARLVVSLVVGKRTEDATHALVRDFHRRTGGRVVRLMTSDEYSVYATAIRQTYGQVVTPPRTGRPGRPRQPYTVMPLAVTYATAHKERKNNRVVGVSTRVVLGTWWAVALALPASAVSRVVNTCLVERYNGIDRNRCSRKVRKSYAFSKDGDTHRAATAFCHFSCNSCWPVGTLRERDADGRWRRRTPAMAAGLTDHVWPLAEWLTFPGVQRK